MAVDTKVERPVAVEVTEDGTNAVVHPGDVINKALRVNVVAGGGSGGTSANFNAAFPGTGTAAGVKASAAAPTWVEGDMVPLSVDLTGTLRTTAGSGGGGSSFSNDGTTAQLARVSDTDSGAGTHWTAEVLLVSPGAGGPTQTGTGSNPLRIDPTGATTQPISASSLPLPAGAATSALQTQISGQLPTVLDGSGFLKIHEQGTANVSVQNSSLAVTQSGAWTVGLSVGTAVKVTDGTNFLPTGDSSARSIHTTIDNASVPVTQSGTWTVQPGNTANTTAWKVDGSAVTQPVSGTVTANQGTAAAIASAWPVKLTDGTNTTAVTTSSEAKVNAPDVTASGSLAVLNDTSVLTLGGNKAAALVQITGTFTGTVQFEATGDGTNWFSITAFGSLSGLAFQSTINAGGNFTFMCGGFQGVRVRASPWTSGTATIVWRAGSGTIGNSFTYARIQDPTSGGPVANVDSTLKALRVSGRSFEVLGVYHASGRTAIYAGLAASAPLVALRNPSATVLLIPLRFKVMVTTTVAATTAGATQRELIIGRSWTVSDTGTAITLTGNNNKRRTSFATSIADLKHGAPLTAGTRTLDANAMGQAFGWEALVFLGAVIGNQGAIGATAATLAGATYGISASGVDLIDRRPDDEYPIVLAQNEGLLLRLGPDAQPGGSTNQTYFDITWAEASSY